MPAYPIDTDWANAIGSFGYDGARGAKMHALGVQSAGNEFDLEIKKRKLREALGLGDTYVAGQQKMANMSPLLEGPQAGVEPFGPPAPIDQAAWENANKQAEHLVRLGGYGAVQSSSVGDIANFPKVIGGANLLSNAPGTPRDPRAREQALLTGTLINPEDKTGGENYIIKNKDGTVQDVVLSRDGLIDMRTRRPIAIPPGGQIVRGAHETLTPKDIGNEGFRLQRIVDASNALANAGPGALSDEKLRELEIIISKENPTSQKIEDIGGRKQLVGYEEKMFPGQTRLLVAEINRRLYGAAAAPPGVVAPAAVPPVVPAVPGVDPLVAPAPAVAAPAPAAAAAAPPVVAAAPRAPGGVSITPIPGGGSGAATHELANRAAFAERAATELEKFKARVGFDRTGALNPKQPIPSALALRLAGSGAVGETATQLFSPDAQEYANQAKTLIEPMIRAASGMAIPPSEYTTYFQMFIPNSGDRPQERVAKIQRVQDWINITRQAATTGQALDMLSQSNDPASRQAAGQLRVKARQAGTLDAPTASPGAVAAPAAAMPDDQAVNELLQRYGVRGR